MQPGRLDGLTKEMIALAVSATNGCTYCIRSHTAAARKLGMDDEMLGELMAVVGTFNQTNRLADGYQVEVDDQLMAASGGRAATARTSVSAALRKSRVAGRKAPRLPRTRCHAPPLIGPSASAGCRRTKKERSAVLLRTAVQEVLRAGPSVRFSGVVRGPNGLKRAPRSSGRGP